MRKFLFIIIVAFTSCQPVEKETTTFLKKVIIDFSNSKTVKTEDLVEPNKVLSLAFSKESVVNAIESIRRGSDLIAILDYDQITDSRSIKIFNIRGEYVSSVKGNLDTPLRFGSAKDILINKEGIEVLDLERILFFNIEGKPIKKEVLVQSSAFKFIKFKNEEYLLYRGNANEFDPSLKSNNNLVYLNSNRIDKFRQYIKINPVFADRAIDGGDIFFESSEHNGYYFQDYFNDTIFLCTNSVKPFLLLNFKDSKDKALKKFINKNYSIASQEYTLEILDLLGNTDVVEKIDYITDLDKNNILTSFTFGNYRYFAKINLLKKTYDLVKLDSELLTNWKIVSYSAREFMIVIENPLRFKSLSEKAVFAKDGKLGKLISSIHNNDTNNPILIIVDKFDFSKNFDSNK